MTRAVVRLTPFSLAQEAVKGLIISLANIFSVTLGIMYTAIKRLYGKRLQNYARLQEGSLGIRGSVQLFLFATNEPRRMPTARVCLKDRVDTIIL